MLHPPTQPRSALKNAVLKCVPCRTLARLGRAHSVGTWGARRDHSAHRTAGPTDASETCTREPVCRRDPTRTRTRHRRLPTAHRLLVTTISSHQYISHSCLRLRCMCPCLRVSQLLNMLFRNGPQDDANRHQGICLAWSLPSLPRTPIAYSYAKKPTALMGTARSSLRPSPL